MKKIVLAVVMMCLLAGMAQAQIPGEWMVAIDYQITSFVLGPDGYVYATAEMATPLAIWRETGPRQFIIAELDTVVPFNHPIIFTGILADDARTIFGQGLTLVKK